METLTIKEVIDIINKKKYRTRKHAINVFLDEKYRIKTTEKYATTAVVDLNDTTEIHCVALEDAGAIYNNIKYYVDEGMKHSIAQYTMEDKPTRDVSKYAVNTNWYIGRYIKLLELEGKTLEAEFAKYFYSNAILLNEYNPSYDHVAQNSLFCVTRDTSKSYYPVPYFEFVVDKATKKVINMYSHIIVENQEMVRMDPIKYLEDNYFFISKLPIYHTIGTLFLFNLGYQNFKYDLKKGNKHVCEIVDIRQMLDVVFYLSTSDDVVQQSQKAPVIFDINSHNDVYLDVEL